MNKMNLLKLALILVLSMAASAAYADKSTGTSTLLGGNSFQASSNVDVHVATDGSTGNFDANNYSARSKHAKGDKIVGCKSGDSKLYFTTVSNVTITTNVTAATGDNYSTWTTM
jgi:hypothetical protein